MNTENSNPEVINNPLEGSTAPNAENFQVPGQFNPEEVPGQLNPEEETLEPAAEEEIKDLAFFDEFISKIAHPRKRALAVSLVEGEDLEVLYGTYGEVRVMEMQKQINQFAKDPRNYEKYKSACSTCGVNPTNEN